MASGGSEEERGLSTVAEDGKTVPGGHPCADVVASYLPLVDFLAEALGPTAEIVLHDLRRKEHSMIAIRNGELTGRRAGDATATEFALRMARRAEERGKPYMANYFGQPAGEKILRSSTYFIRDEDRSVVGMLGINVDLTQLLATRQMVDRLLGLAGADPAGFPLPGPLGSALSSERGRGGPDRDPGFEEEAPAAENPDRSVEQVEQMVYAVLDRVLSACKVAPPRLTAREKREVVEELNARGVFLLKGVVTEVARRLAVSEQTVYRYLKS